MTKNNLNNAVENLLGGQQQTAPQRIKRDARSRSRAALSQAVDKNVAGYEAVTISVNSQYYAKIKEIAFAENLTIKKVVEQAMSHAINVYEERHGEIKLKKIKQGNEKDLFI